MLDILISPYWKNCGLQFGKSQKLSLVSIVMLVGT